MITLLAGLLAFVIAYIMFGAKYQWVQASKVIEQTIQETKSASYYQIARLEQGIWDGNSFHNGLPRDNDKPCECNTICHPDTFYIPTAQPPPLPGYEYGYGLPSEWRDHDGP